jgi:carboxylesterase type B
MTAKNHRGTRCVGNWWLSLVVLCGLLCGSAQSQTNDRWLDYAGSDYDIFPNVTYAKANNIELKLDLYLPKTRTNPTPTLILFHGGGWVDGQKERNVLYLLPYLAMGWSAVNVEYRTGHQSPAPAAVEDARCALRWIASHAREYSLDSSKFVLTGTSAGGHLSLIAGMLPANNIFDRQCTVEGGARWNSSTVPEIKVAAIINWFGIGDVADLLEGPNA